MSRLSRRALLRLVTPLAAAAVLASTTAGCGGTGDLAALDTGRNPGRPETAADVVAAFCAFSVDLLGRSLGDRNLVCSPFSVLTTLAMVRNGATGETARQLDRTLHLPSLAGLNAGLNAVTQTLDSRSGTRQRADRSTAEVSLELANAVWGQTGTAWQTPFLHTLATDYCTGVRQQDFRGDPERARRGINRWVSDQTHDRIPEIVPEGVITALTRLVLVNALHLQAPWLAPLHDAGSQPFHTSSGPRSAPMISGIVTTGGLPGTGWRGARLLLAGGELAMTVVLPDSSVPALLDQLDRDGLRDLLAQSPGEDVGLTLPTFTFSSVLPLTDTLQAMGITRAFSDLAQLDGLATAEPLRLAQVLHQGWVAVDAEGIEAAAATVASVEAVSGRMPPRLTVVVDRPFLFCVHDVALGLPLLAGVVNDPTLHG